MKNHPVLQFLLAELLGSIFLTFFSQVCFCNMLCGYAIDAKHLIPNKETPSIWKIQWLSYAIGSGMSFFVAKSVVSAHSGVHINPIFTFASTCLNIRHALTWGRTFFAIISQYIGAFFGALLTFSIFNEAILELMSQKTGATREIFASYSKAGTQLVTLMWGHILSNCLLVVIFLLCYDVGNDGFLITDLDRSLAPAITGAAITAVQLSFATLAILNLNPAVDLSSRLLSSIWEGDTVWILPLDMEGNGKHFFWTSAILPYVGALLGVLIYVFAVSPYRVIPAGNKGTTTAHGPTIARQSAVPATDNDADNSSSITTVEKVLQPSKSDLLEIRS